jgi:hypothetical protein
MTSFINAKYSDHHRGADRAESEVDAAQQFSSTRGVALLLLSAMAAAVMVVAYEVMDTTAEGHLLVMWMGVWAALFAVLVLLAGMALRLKGRLDAWSYRVAQARADQRLWAMAKQDSRLMSDLQLAMMRKEALAEAAQSASAQTGKAEPMVQLTPFMARSYARDYI